MKPKDKERLVRARPQMMRTLDVEQILPKMRAGKLYTKEEEQEVMSDNRRRERVVRFLNIMEKKKTEVYDKFQDILGDYYPQLLLALTDWEEEGDDPLPSHAQLDDEWTMLQRARQYLIHEIDAGHVVKYMKEHGALSAQEADSVVMESSPETRTEVFLDMLELHPHAHYDIFVDAVGEVYPHVYLTLTGEDQGNSDDDDW